MNFDETIHTAVQIQAIQDPPRLERARHLREATIPTHHRSRLSWEVGKWLKGLGEWLQGPLPVVEPPVSPR